MRSLALVLALLSCAVLLAGCSASNGPGGQSAGAPGSLAYNGASSGTQTSEAFTCDGSGSVSVSANLGSGSVTFTVKDGSGKVAYTKSVGSAGQASDSKDVSGASGSWTITASRGAGFTGQYAVNVQC
jgi:predicted small secreted protein